MCYRRPVKVRSIAVLVLLSACSDGGDATVRIAPQIVAPKGLLDRVRALKLEVVDAASGIACDTARGTTTGITASTARVASANLTAAACSGQGRFCGAVEMDTSATSRVFIATGTDEGGATFMTGCATAVVDSATSQVSIKMLRSLPKATCGNGSVEITEQCEGTGDAQCDAACHSVEFLVSSASADNGTIANAAKTAPVFAWADGKGDAGRFFAVFGDGSPGAGNDDVSARLLSDVLAPIPTVPFAASFFLPNDPAVTPPKALAGNQRHPAVATSGAQKYVVYEDDGTGVDVALRTLDANFKATALAPLVVSNVAGDQTNPAIASGPQGNLFIVWQDNATSKIFGRTLTLPATLGPEQELSNGGTNRTPAVAATPSGYLVVWESGGDIKLRVVGADGTPGGGDTTVNEAVDGAQEEPRIASLADGRYAIAWTDRAKADDANVMVQRFAANGRKVAGDQSKPVHEVQSKGDQQFPAVAAASAVGGSFVVGWSDKTTGHVRARFLGGSAGFLLNPTDGTETDFQVSLAEGHTRERVTIATGGATPAIAFGWEDKQGTAPSTIVLRRFPAPTR
jgi:hypothetical protein